MDESEDEDDGAPLEQWLSELEDALEQAQRITSLLGLARGRSAETRELYQRLELARTEVEHLRQTARTDIDQLHPDWIKSLTASAGALGPAE